jgi:hypothetical protein
MTDSHLTNDLRVIESFSKLFAVGLGVLYLLGSLRDHLPPENGSSERRLESDVAWRIISDHTISLASKEVMSSAGSRLIDASDKSLVMFSLSNDPTPRNTAIMSSLFSRIHANWTPHIWHTFEEAFYYLSSVNSASFLVYLAKPDFEIEKTPERRGRRCVPATSMLGCMQPSSPSPSFAFRRQVSSSCSERIPGMAAYGIEFNDKVKSFLCPHCGEESLTVWGWVSKDNAAHAVYFANLMTGHQETSARLTISIGGWGDENDLTKRKWVYIEARPVPSSYQMMVREPQESLYSGKPLLGKALTRSEALASPLLKDFFAVADYIAFNDPAVKSYLIGEQVSSKGRDRTPN